MTEIVLVIDDHADSRAVIRYDLEEDGYAVLEASNGRAGISMAWKQQPSCILLDSHMPGLNGVEVCKRLKARTTLRHIPILMLSGDDRDETIVNCLEAGACDFIAKPFSYPIVRARIANAIRLAKAQQTATQAVADATRSNEDKTRFFLGLNSEFRSPLQGVVSNADALLHLDAGREIYDHASAILDCGVRLNSLLTNVQDLVCFERGELTLENEPVSIPHLLQEITAAMRSQVRERRCDLIFIVDRHTPGIINGDEIRLRQVLFNLLSNAFRVSSKGHVILRICCLPGQSAIRFEVIDSGPGIEGEDLDRLFQPFSRHRQARSGSGLSMSLVKFILRAMNSEIRVHSRPGKGTEFHFDIPQDHDEQHLPHEDLRTKQPVTNVLVVTQNRMIWESIAQADSMRCCHCTDVRTIGSVHNDIAIVDENFPNLIDAVRFLRDIADIPKIALLAWNRHSMCDDKRITWIPKPFFPWSTDSLLGGGGSLLETRQSMSTAKAGPRAARGRILVADSNGAEAGILSALLMQMGYLCKVVHSGRDVTELLNVDQNFQLIVMSHDPEHASRSQAVPILKQFYADEFPVIGLLNPAAEESAEDLLELGYDDVLHKPVQRSEIESCIDKWLHGAGEAVKTTSALD